MRLFVVPLLHLKACLIFFGMLLSMEKSNIKRKDINCILQLGRESISAKAAKCKFKQIFFPKLLSEQ